MGGGGLDGVEVTPEPDLCLFGTNSVRNGYCEDYWKRSWPQIHEFGALRLRSVLFFADWHHLFNLINLLPNNKILVNNTTQTNTGLTSGLLIFMQPL